MPDATEADMARFAEAAAIAAGHNPRDVRDWPMSLLRQYAAYVRGDQN